MATGDHEFAASIRLQQDRSLALVLAAAGAAIFAGSLAPWPEIDILHPFSEDAANPFWLEHGYLTLVTGAGIVIIASRIAVEAGRRRRPWDASGPSLILLVMGLIAAWLSFDLFGEATFQGLTPFSVAFFAGLAIIGSRLPMSATARRPRSVAFVLAGIALGDYLVLLATVMLADPEWGPSLSGLEVGWIGAVLGGLIATVVAWRLRTRASP